MLPTEDIGKCSLCNIWGHLQHLEEWVSENGKCPYCQKETVIIEVSEKEKRKGKL